MMVGPDDLVEPISGSGGQDIEDLRGILNQLKVGKPPAAAPAAPTDQPLATVPGTTVDMGGEQPDPLGIRPMAGSTSLPIEGMDPNRQALARSVFGMAEKGSASLGRGMAATQGFVDDLPKTLPEFLERAKQPQNVRGILRGTGAAVGGLMGTPAGPLGVVGGAGAGSATGSYMANMYDSIRDSMNGVPPAERPALMEQLLRPAIDAGTDAAFTGAFVALPGAVGATKNILARVLRLPPNSRELVEEAATLGVDIGVANVANGGVGKAAVNVFGRMPFLGGKAREASAQQGKAVVQAYKDMFDPLANSSSTTEIGQAALDAAKAQYGDCAVKATKRFEHALRVGQESGATFSSDKVLKATGQVLADLSSKSGKLQGVAPADMRVWLNGLVKNAGDDLTLADISSISTGLEGLLRKAKGSHGVHYSKLEGIQEALDKTVAASDLPAARLYSKANEFFKEGVKDFDNKILQKMVGKVERDIYAIGKQKQGTMTADDLMATAEKVTSVKGVQDLRAAAGDDVIKHVARARLDDAWVKATGKEPGTLFVGEKLSFDADRFRSALGLDRPNSSQYNTMKEMLRGTGVEVEHLDKLARVTSEVVAAPIADASTFMARAAVLRGAGGVAEAVKGAMTMGAAGKASEKMGMPTAFASIVMARWGVGAMMKPNLVMWLTNASDNGLSYAARAAAVAHIATEYPSLFNE